jgi:glycosyltransferase involved in cell wall biosynthesis
MLAEGFAPHLVQPLHNGIEIGPQTTVFARRHARRQLGIDHRSLVVGTVARLDPVKDLPTLIDAFALMRRDRADARLVVIGDGPERQALTDAAARADVAGAVLFTGHRQDVRALLPAFDIFANSSIHEGVSLTILEAMAADIPVVATRAGGNPEVVDAASGLLVPCRDVAAFAGALAALATDDARRQRMGAAARARVESRFSVERMVGAYLASYRGDPRPADTGIPASVAAGS